MVQTKTRNEEICGSFTVETENHEIKRVVICQADVTHYDKTVSYNKQLRLNTPTGPVVFKTDDAAVFQLANGTMLKRKKGRAATLHFFD